MQEKDLQIRPQWVIRHGLYLELERYKVDGRSGLGQTLARSKAALAAIFPNGPDAAANILINQIVWKALRLELFMNYYKFNLIDHYQENLAKFHILLGKTSQSQAA